jgi:DNA-binding beta-propeller fold protein YncE
LFSIKWKGNAKFTLPFYIKKNEMNRKITQLTLGFLTSLAILSGSCSRHLTKFDPGTAKYYPAPPDTARLQFLTSISNSSQITGRRSGFARFVLGELPSYDIVKPYGIATHGEKIYICDTELKGLEIIDLKKNDYSVFTPTGKGQLNLPLNCCLDEEGKLYVADGVRKQVVIFDNSLNYIDAIGEGEDFKPTDVFVRGAYIYVINLTGNQVVVYDRVNRYRIFAFPESEKGNDDFLYSPTNLFASDSIVYVSDMGDSKVKLFSHDGHFISSFGSYGKNLGQFVRIKGIAVDHESNIYAVDAAFENVQVFTESGQLLMYFGGPYSGPGDMWLPAKVAIDYENMDYFQQYVDPAYKLEYLVYVTNQYGPDKIGVYGFIKPKPITN